MANITKNHIPQGRPNRPQVYINPAYITLHDADNLAGYADAQYYANLLNTDDTVGAKAWHYTVDGLDIIEHLPTDEMALHISTSTADPGNDTSISITICRNAGGNRAKAEENALGLIRYLQALYAIPTKNVVPHQYFDQGANCPELLLPRWDDFLQTLEQRGEATNPDRQIFIFDQSETMRAVLTNGSPGACPYFDAIHKEQINGENTLEFSVPAKHADAGYITEESLVVIKDLDEDFYQLFVIKEVAEVHEQTIYKRAYCEHAALELVDEIVEDRRPENETARNLLAALLTGTRWEVGIVNEMGTVPQLNFYYESVISGIHKIINAFKCEVRYRVKLAGGAIVGRYVDLLYRRGHNTGRRFQYARDMKKVARTVDSTMVKTALYGRGKGEENGDGFGRRVTFADVVWEMEKGHPVDKPMGQEWVGDPDALATFGRFNNDGTLRHRFGIYENEEQTDPAKLLEETWAALQQNKMPLVEYRMEVVDLESVTGYTSEKVRLGDTVLCIDREFNPPLAVEARVIELIRHLDESDKAEVNLGNFVPKITNTLARLERVEKKIRDKEGMWDDKLGAPGGVVETLRAEIRAGKGTVKLSHNNGILITDNDYNPTRAMRLLGGVFALANSKDPVTGEWNWTTFGTADGFTADLITAGTMSFDRARGGTLALGGPGNGYGRLQVYNESGDVIADLDARVGGFRELYVGKLKGNVITANYEDLTFYVDAVNGDDENTGLSEYQPLKTVQRAIDKTPKFNYGQVDILVTAGQTLDETLIISGFFGKGSIAIDFQGSVLNGYINVFANNMGIAVSNAVVNHINTGGTISDLAGSICIMSSNCEVNSCDFYSNNKSNSVAVQSGYVMLDNCQMFDAALNAIDVMNGGTVYVNDCQGSGAAFNGIYAFGPCIVGGYAGGMAPQGNTADVNVTDGGSIPVIFTHSAGARATLPAPPTHYGWHIANVEVWNELQGWGVDQAGAIQGAWESTGNYKTLLFLDTADLKAQLNGKTVRKTLLKLERLAEGGYPKAEPVYLWMHDYKSRPPGEPRLIFPIGVKSSFVWGEERWVELPTWTVDRLINGHAQGFAMYVAEGGHFAKFKTGDYNMMFKVIFTD